MEHSELSAVNLSKSYGGRKVVDGVSLSLESGEIVGLLGPNGAGKTTTFYMIVGLIAAESGKILINDIDITKEPMYLRARRGLGYLPQEPSVFRKLSVRENILAIVETLDGLSERQQSELVEKLLDEFELAHLSDAIASSLSGGERRRVEIARALVRSPRFMLLDEPFAGIDPIIVRDLKGMIKKITERGIGVLITDHNVRDTLDICDRAYILVDGKILVDGTPEEISTSDLARRYYLGEDFALLGTER
ncbi:MAG: LPS export ABC transporter ATP-binding protein [Candidatus Dadabacteria bacterium]|nr:MAG: LPS export ABC transporter ATP-binding protein [Candidatus Dadabacteria bacterium]